MLPGLCVPAAFFLRPQDSRDESLRDSGGLNICFRTSSSEPVRKGDLDGVQTGDITITLAISYGPAWTSTITVLRIPAADARIEVQMPVRALRSG